MSIIKDVCFTVRCKVAFCIFTGGVFLITGCIIMALSKDTFATSKSSFEPYTIGLSMKDRHEETFSDVKTLVSKLI